MQLLNTNNMLPNSGVRDADPPQYVLNPSESKEIESMVGDSESDSAKKIYSILNSSLSDETKEYLVQYFMNDSLSKNAFSREYEASKQQYQNAVKDLQKAGISPFLAFDGLRSASASSSSGSASGGFLTQRKNQRLANMTDIGTKIFTVLAIIAAAAIRYMV